MNLISLENISKNYSEKTLLNNISLGINEGEKINELWIFKKRIYKIIYFK